jgi:F0F1-type ATP synthase membrane subunit a
MLALVITTYLIRKALDRHKQGIVAFCVRTVCKSLKSTIEEALGSFDREVFDFIFGLFLFTLSCNYIGIIPLFGEPTTDINTPLAIGISSFCYVQYQGLKHKQWGYFRKYFSPIFILFPLNVIQQLAKIASLSFRLFGNMLGDTIIWSLLLNLLQSIWFFYVPLIVLALLFLYLNDKYGWSKKIKSLNAVSSFTFYFVSAVSFLEIFFGLFGGLIQAYVVSLLTVMYISTERSKEGGH